MLLAGRRLLAADEAAKFDDDAALAAFQAVFSEFIERIPGNVRARIRKTAEQFGMPDLAT
jgi:hypothetical protein